MRVWLYYRLSRDEDKELNSLTNQKQILVESAEAKGYIIIGESFDDNVSGMHFNRDGIEQIYDQVEKKTIDAIVVKDLSRLGRHKTQTALFIDYLREHDVRVLSVTENIDTSNEDDDLIVGFKGIFNDMYCRDISKKIRAGYRQKQKNGIVIIPPMGYFKDKNTGQVVIVEEQAAIVRRIFSMYLDGYGLKAIAHTLNREGIKSQGYYQLTMLGKKLGYNKPEIARRYLWENTGIKRLLQNEFYAGTLVCHKSYTNKMNHIRKELPPEEHFRHENFVPAIVSREVWEQVQILLKNKVERNVRASSGNPYHRYTGLIQCANCGSTFCCKKRKNKGVPDRYEYTCNGYHRYGKENCSPHRIHEEVLDKLIYDELLRIKQSAERNYKSIEKDIKKWLSQSGNFQNRLSLLSAKLEQRKKDQQAILLERIRDREHAEVYTEMLASCEKDIQAYTAKIEGLKNHDETIKSRKAKLKESIDLLDDIIKDGAISNSHLRMLIDKIVIYENNDEQRITINIKADFRRHIDLYDENGTLGNQIFSDVPFCVVKGMKKGS